MQRCGGALDRIERVALDVERACLERSIYMIGPEKARFLRELVTAKKPRLVVECGTAIGYSGLHFLAAITSLGKGKLVTVELVPSRAAEARENFRRAGVDAFVEVLAGDAEEVLGNIAGPGGSLETGGAFDFDGTGRPVDFLFLDNDFGNYSRSFHAIEPRLSDGALVLADNTGIGAGEMGGYLAYVRSRFRSECRWFDTNLPWAERDAMEITEYRSRRLSDDDMSA